jgi:hypothetical protein
MFYRLLRLSEDRTAERGAAGCIDLGSVVNPLTSVSTFALSHSHGYLPQSDEVALRQEKRLAFSGDRTRVMMKERDAPLSARMTFDERLHQPPRAFV